MLVAEATGSSGTKVSPPMTEPASEATCGELAVPESMMATTTPFPRFPSACNSAALVKGLLKVVFVPDVPEVPEAAPICAISSPFRTIAPCGVNFRSVTPFFGWRPGMLMGSGARIETSLYKAAAPASAERDGSLSSGRLAATASTFSYSYVM